MEFREANLNDLAQVGIVCEASGRARWTSEMLVRREDRIALVAVGDGEVVGAAKTHFHQDPDGDAPAGHYLGGIVVSPGHRRRGVGSTLTRMRLDWISERAAGVYYFTDEQNSPSIKMHEALGFQLIGPFASIRGVTADVAGSSLLLFMWTS